MALDDARMERRYAASPGGLLAVLALGVATLTSATARAQSSERVSADLLFYGDNTEFSNPFREGETLLGAALRVELVVPVGQRVEIRGGVFGNERFGSDRAFEQVRPVLAMVLRGPNHEFVFGTLPEPSATSIGPDRQNRHGLLPALQSETLAFTRPWEAGLQWKTSTNRLRQSAWLNWQELNTSAHRERFDTGVVGEAPIGPGLSFQYQWHLVHHGGQLFAAGPVSDSQAAALGIRVDRPSRVAGDLSLEGWGLLSRDVPDRERPDGDRTGRALFVRAEARRRGWRTHVLVFRGDDYVKEEGDPNYQAERRDGRAFTAVRDYAEAGVSRHFNLAPGVSVEASLRFHRTEAHYEYSYRLLGRTQIGWVLR